MTVGVALQDFIGQLRDFFSNKTGHGHLNLFGFLSPKIAKFGSYIV